MEIGVPKNLFLRRLAALYRVLLLGGMAVIAHGRSRRTKDFNIWLEPMNDESQWASALRGVLAEFPDAYVWSLAERRQITPKEIEPEVSEFGVVRVGGLGLPIDVFRRPNGIEVESFDAVWNQANTLEDGLGLPNELDLYLTKADTGRRQDEDDIAFLESKVNERFKERLPVCDLAEALHMLERYTDPALLLHAKANPSKDVRDLALKYLREFAAEGDPYSRDILVEWKEE